MFHPISDFRCKLLWKLWKIPIYPSVKVKGMGYFSSYCVALRVYSTCYLLQILWNGCCYEHNLWTDELVSNLALINWLNTYTFAFAASLTYTVHFWYGLQIRIDHVRPWYTFYWKPACFKYILPHIITMTSQCGGSLERADKIWLKIFILSHHKSTLHVDSNSSINFPTRTDRHQ